MSALLRCWVSVALISCACAPKPSQPKVREPVSEKDRRDEAESPVEAPPPAYGNKVVDKPREGTEKRASEPPRKTCRVSQGASATEEPDGPATCVHSSALVP